MWRAGPYATTFICLASMKVLLLYGAKCICVHHCGRDLQGSLQLKKHTLYTGSHLSCWSCCLRGAGNARRMGSANLYIKSCRSQLLLCQLGFFASVIVVASLSWHWAKIWYLSERGPPGSSNQCIFHLSRCSCGGQSADCRQEADFKGLLCSC